MKERKAFACSGCGAQSPQWRGQCPRCQEWNTLREVRLSPSASGASSTRARDSIQGFGGLSESPVALQDVPLPEVPPRSAGLPALDRLLGGGLSPGATILLSGEPGIGKSTILLQVAGAMAAQGGLCLYVSGEESLDQIRTRAARLGVLDPRLLAMATTRVEDALAILEDGADSPQGREVPALLVVDSVQTVSSGRAEGLPGSVSQVRAVAAELIERAKKKGTALLLVGHVTKDGQIAGPKLMEHMVDTVLSLEGDRRNPYRLLRSLKNRFGPTQELVVLRMEQKGLAVVDDPSTLFLGDRNPELSGAAVVMAIDGQRPFAVEVQALVSRSFLSIPRRTALGFDVNRLHLLLAVLEKRLRCNFGQVDVYAKIGGGLRMHDPGMDLGLVAALLSSLHDVALPERAVFWGEIDLNGQVRPVVGHDIRLPQAERLGYNPIVCPGADSGKHGISSLRHLQPRLFPKTEG